MATFTPENPLAAVDIRLLMPWFDIRTIGNIEINVGQTAVVSPEGAPPHDVNYLGGTDLTASGADPTGGTFTTITVTGVGTLSGTLGNFAAIDDIDAFRILDGDDIITGSTQGLDFLFAGYGGGNDELNGNGGGDNFVVAERIGTPFLTITGASNVVDTLFVWSNIYTSATFLDLRISNLNSIDAITLDPGTRAIILAAQLGSAISTTAVIGAFSGNAVFDIVKQTNGGTFDASALSVNQNTLFRIFGTTTGETITGNDDGPTDLHPGAGIDTVNGGSRGDFFFVAGNEGEFDTLNGGGGADTLTVEGTASLVLNRFNTLTSSIEIFDGNGKGVLGNGNANVFNLVGLTARSGLPFVNAGAGKDTITGSKFADMIVASGSEAQFDVMKGGLGPDTLRAAGGASLVLDGFNAAAASIERFEGNGKGLVGNADRNVVNLAGLTTVTGLPFIDGGGGNDTITGNSGANRIIGGRGADTMNGGAGAVRDVFDFNAVNETGRGAATRDKIIGFQHLRDDIDLSTIDANGAAAGHKFAFLATKDAVFNGVRGELRWFQEDRQGGSNDKTIIAGDINGDKVADLQIELKGLITLTGADFIL